MYKGQPLDHAMYYRCITHFDCMKHEGVGLELTQSETVAVKLSTAYQESTSLTHVLLVVYSGTSL